MLCHTVSFALFQLGQPVPLGLEVPAFMTADPPPFGGDSDRPSSIGSLDSDSHDIRCHWADAEDASRCDAVLRQAEDAWDAQVTGAGFNPPEPDSDGILDIYLTTEGTGWGAYTWGPARDAVSGDGRNSTAAFIAMDSRITDADMDGYTIHEFNHVLQYATDYAEPTYMIWESVASAAERWTYPDPDVYEVAGSYVKDFQATPWMGILGDGYFLWDEYELYSFYEYGGMIWAFHLDERWGDGAGSAGAALWAAAAQEGLPNEPDVLDAYDAVTGDWRAALLDLSIQRARIGTDLAPSWAAWKAEGYQVGVAETVAWGDLPAELSPEIGPYETGTVYVEVTGVPEGQVVDWAFDSTSSVAWGGVAVQGAAEDQAMGRSGSFSAAGDGDVLIGAVNLGADDFDADDTVRSAAVTIALSQGDASAGGTDSGGTADGGSDDTGRPPLDREEPGDGKGCNAALTEAGAAWLIAIGLLGFRRRR